MWLLCLSPVACRTKPLTPPLFPPTPCCFLHTQADGSYKEVKEWVLDTDGVDLLSILAHPLVDKHMTTSNDIVEIGKVRLVGLVMLMLSYACAEPVADPTSLLPPLFPPLGSPSGAWYRSLPQLAACGDSRRDPV